MDEIKNTILRMLNAVEEYADSPHISLHSQLDLIDYLGNCEKLIPYFHSLIESGRIAPKQLHQIYDDFLIRQLITRPTPQPLSAPKFYSDAIEKKYSLRKEFLRQLKKEGALINDDSIIDADKPVIKMKSKEDYFWLQRLCYDLIDLLEKEPTRALPQLDFDPVKSRLYVQGKEIKIRKQSDQYHLLRIIFLLVKTQNEEISKEWFFSEIAENIDDAHDGGDKKYYNAAYQIQLKLKSTGLTDFFILTTTSAQISKKYLS